jgi:C4-dicarboxylate transporter DctQ subunit
VPVDVNPYDMGDNLHPRDLKHKQIGEGRDKQQGGKK